MSRKKPKFTQTLQKALRKKVSQIITAWEQEHGYAGLSLDHPDDKWAHSGLQGLKVGKSSEGNYVEVGTTGMLPLPLLLAISDEVGCGIDDIEMSAGHRVNIQTEYTFDSDEMVVTRFNNPIVMENYSG